MSIISIEGLDASGKNSLAKQLARELNMKYIDTEFQAHPDKSLVNWTDVVQGINIMQCQMYKSLDNFVKARFSLSEYVYSKYYNRISLIDQYEMESCGIEKNYLIYIDVDYGKYVELSSKYRLEEPIISEIEFDKQRTLFLEAYKRTLIINKVIIKNDGSFENLLDKALKWIFKIEKSKLANIYRDIVGCNKCPNMSKSCSEVNPKWNHPIIPALESVNPEYIFILDEKLVF